MNNKSKFLNQSLTGHEIIKILQNTPTMRYQDRTNNILVFCHGDIYDNICKALENKEYENE